MRSRHEIPKFRRPAHFPILSELKFSLADDHLRLHRETRFKYMPRPIETSPPALPPPPDVQTLPEVAHLLRVNVETVRRLAEKGEIAGAFKIGGQWRFNRLRLEAMIQGN